MARREPRRQLHLPGPGRVYLRDFFRGHFAVEDVVFVAAEMTNSLVDPTLAKRRGEHEDSRAAALEAARRLAGELAASGHAGTGERR